MSELEDHAAPAFAHSSAAGDRSANQVAGGIERDAFVRLSAIRSAGEVVEHRVDARRRDLEHRASAECASLYRRAVEIARLVSHQLGVGVFTAGIAGEAVDQSCRTCRPRY